MQILVSVLETVLPAIHCPSAQLRQTVPVDDGID